MLRHGSTQARQILLLDFLAPSLVQLPRRSYTTQKYEPQNEQPPPTEKKPSFPLQASSTPLLFAKLRANVHEAQHSTSKLSADKIERFNETVGAIRHTLNGKQNPKTLLGLWKTLDELKVVHMLGCSQLVPLSAFMIQTFLAPGAGSMRHRKSEGEKSGKRIEAGALKLTPPLEQLAHNIALVAARNDSWDAIGALMRYYIQEGNAEAILSLYDKFMALVGDKNLKAELELESAGSMEGEGQEEKGAEETKNSLATDTELKSERFPAVPAGRVHVLMAVVTAHAMKDSFKDALDACTRTVVQLSETLGVSFIQQTFKHNLALRDKVKSYFTRLFAAGLISHPASFVHYVTRLGTRKSADSLEKFYHVISTGLSGEDAFLVADPSLVTETRTIALTPMCWTALLSAFLKCNRKNSAAQLWDDMTSAGAPPGISMWTALLDSYGEIRAADDAIATWEMMIQQGVKPDTLAYRAIISALFKGRRPVDAMRMFEEYKKLPVVEGPHRLSLYNTILHGLCLTPERAEEAEKIRKAMEKEGPRPDMVTYNTFINYYGRRQQFQGVAATVRAMQEFGFEGDVFTYTTILSALLKVGKTDAAELVLALMDKQGVKKNVALYSSLIEHQFRAGTEQNFRAAMLMLAKMEKDPENQPNEITYTSVLCGLYRLGWMDPEDLQRIEANIIQRIRQRNVSLGLPAYHLLLKTCLVYPHENGVQQAMAYYEEMKKREIPIINTTWYILLAGLLNKGEWTLADKMVGEMYASGIHPTNSLLRLVHQINSRASGRGRM